MTRRVFATRTLSVFLLATILVGVVAPALAAPNTDDVIYIVRRGDTLFSIARRFGVSLSALATANGISNPALIYVGQRLVIPGASSSTSTSVGAASGGNTGSTGPCAQKYIVQRGDTLRLIASKCGATVAALVSANRIANPNLIFVGQVLTIPNGASAPTAAPQGQPTAAPVATSAPTAIPTTPPPVVNTGHGLTGALTLCNPEKPSFAVKIERICFRERIVNNTDQPVKYGVLGVQATNLGGGPSQFQTSWRGDLTVPARGVGPTGDGWEDGIYIDSPGAYRFTLSICYSNTDTCLSGGEWETLTSGVNVTTIIWNP